MEEEFVFRGGKNIAMKVPTRQFDAVVTSYRNLGLSILSESKDCVSFEYGPLNLHIDRVDYMSQAELWLEFVTTDLDAAASRLSENGFERCDEIENLEGHTGFWVSSPASVIHLVTENE